MLGNFSFGDYYKRDAILFAWELLTERWAWPAEKLYVTVHTERRRSAATLGARGRARAVAHHALRRRQLLDDGPDRAVRTVHRDLLRHRPENASGPDDRGPNLGNRYVEIWNLVFQQYNRSADGVLHDLPRKGIDTGAGFERILAVTNGKASMYETDLFLDLIAAQPDVGATPLPFKERIVRRRIIADHARAVTFLVADGVYPGNTDRGYVLRFLTRRAIRNGGCWAIPTAF
jgi:alanyl-tRNA synthetase